MNIADFDPANLADEFYVDPYPTYAQLRAEVPVFMCPDGSYFLTRYEDINAVYRDPRQFSSDKRLQFAPVFGDDSPLYAHHTTSLVFNDPPLHTRVRKAIGNALSMQMVRAMRDDLVQIVARLLDDMRGVGQVDLVADFAAAIPVEVIGNMLGVPQTERGPLRQWSLNILGALEVGVQPQQLAEGDRSVREFLAYLQEFVPRRVAHLTDSQDDILARLLRWEDAQGGLQKTELYHQCIFLLNAGHETTTNLIANGIELLIRHPQQLQRLAAQPELIGTAVEEMLRYESPNQLGNRTTTEAVEIGGVDIPAGTVLTLCIGAANRDPAQFPDPDRFDICREVNQHLAFGAGIHTCAGLNVARLEATVAIGGLVRRYPRMRLCRNVVRARRARFRGFASLPVQPE